MLHDADLVTDTITILRANRPDALDHIRALYAPKLVPPAKLPDVWPNLPEAIIVQDLIADAAEAVETIDADELETYAAEMRTGRY